MSIGLAGTKGGNLPHHTPRMYTVCTTLSTGTRCKTASARAAMCARALASSKWAAQVIQILAQGGGEWEAGEAGGDSGVQYA